MEGEGPVYNLEAFSCSLCPKRWSFKRLQSEKPTILGSKRRTRVQNAIRGPLHCSSTKIDTDVIHMMKWTRPSPLCFCILHTTLQVIETGGLGMRLLEVQICPYKFKGGTLMS